MSIVCLRRSNEKLVIPLGITNGEEEEDERGLSP